MSDKLSPMLDVFDEFIATWPQRPSFQRAIDESVERYRYKRSDVEQQLLHVIQRTRAQTMREVCRRELKKIAENARDNAPKRVMVLAAATVPGLAIEGWATALTLGGLALVRPSRDETVLHPLLDDLASHAPALADSIELVGVETDSLDFSRADAAIVFGSDETIEFVRSKLNPSAANRVAGYGTKEGIAVLTSEGCAEQPDWAARLAADITRFNQRGCMSPSHVFVSADHNDYHRIKTQLQAAIRAATPDADVSALPQKVAQRQRSDDDFFRAHSSQTQPVIEQLTERVMERLTERVTERAPEQINYGEISITLQRFSEVESLIEEVHAQGSKLQTAVLVAARHETDFSPLLLDAGTTRICAAGEAHFPDPLWPHDGIGRIAPLMGVEL